MAKKTAKKTQPAAPPADDLTPTEQLIRAQATGNPAVVREARVRLGLVAPPTHHDALTRTSRKPAPKAAAK